MVAGLELRLAAGGAITGRILGVASADLGRVRLTAFDEDGRGASAQSQVSRDGGYRISPLAPGRWDVHAWLGDGRSVRGSIVSMRC